MAEFPKQYAFPDPLVHVSTLAMTSVGSLPIGTASAPASAAYPTANLAILVPFRIGRPMTVTTMFAYNGSAVSGNIDLGIYSADGTKIVSTGSTAQSGTSVIQSISVTSTQIGSGQFYMAVALDNTTGTLLQIPAKNAPANASMGLSQMASAFALPATVTFATCANNYVPIIGLTGRSVV